MFFILGSARSGTTLLRMMLNAHPDVAVPPESRFIVELYNGNEVIVSDFLGALDAHKRWPAWELSSEAVAAELGARERVSYVAAVEACYSAFAKSRHKVRFGDKTPRYVEHIPFLASLWPQARFVHLVRDGRAVAQSYADVPFGPKRVAKAAELWSRRVDQGVRDGRALGPGRYLELRYESLVEDPEVALKALCAFLGLDFDPAMLEYSERSKGEVLDRARRYNPNVTRQVSHTRSWIDEMPKAQVEVFEAVGGGTLSALGYDRHFPNPRLWARLLASLGRAGVPVGRLRGRNQGPARSGAQTD
ncbi:MAG: sulfotransferase family protein [Actinomycetota bacterium]